MLIFSERLRNQRKLKSKTQKDLAEALDISRTAYGEYELGNHLPTVDKLIKLSYVLDVSIDYLLGRDDDQQINISETLDFIVQNIKSGNTDFSGFASELIACSIEKTNEMIKLIERSVQN